MKTKFTKKELQRIIKQSHIQIKLFYYKSFIKAIQEDIEYLYGYKCKEFDTNCIVCNLYSWFDSTKKGIKDIINCYKLELRDIEGEINE